MIEYVFKSYASSFSYSRNKFSGFVIIQSSKNLFCSDYIIHLLTKNNANVFFSFLFVDKMYSSIFRQVRNKLSLASTLRTGRTSVYEISLFTRE